MISEELLRKKAQNYILCYSEQCEKSSRCLRSILKQYIDGKTKIVRSVNLINDDVVVGNCPMYKSNEKTIYPIGLTHLFDDIPKVKALQIKKALESRLGRSNYYRYRNGELILKKEVTDIIESTMQKYGWNTPPRYDGFIEDIQW